MKQSKVYDNPENSALRSLLHEIVNDKKEFIHTDIEEFKTVVLTFLEKNKGVIREQDRRKMILTVHQEQKLEKLQFYIYNSLLCYEGHGLVGFLNR